MPPVPANPGRLLGALRTALFGKGLRGAQDVQLDALAALEKKLMSEGKAVTRESMAPARFLNWVETAEPRSFGHYRVPGGEGRGLLASMLIGNRGTRTLRGRYHLGGLLGKGGLVRGELAWNPALVQAVRRARQQGWTPENLKSVAWNLPGDALSKSFLLGFPAYGIGKTLLTGGDPRFSTGQQVGSELGSALAWSLAGPLGMAGFLPASAAGMSLGHRIGGAIDPQSPQQRMLERRFGSDPTTSPGQAGGLAEIVRRSAMGAEPS